MRDSIQTSNRHEVIALESNYGRLRQNWDKKVILKALSTAIPLVAVRLVAIIGQNPQIALAANSLNDFFRVQWVREYACKSG